MANYEDLKDIINNPTQHGLPAWNNDANQIEGVTMKGYLLALIDSLTVGYQFMGVATPSTNPGTLDQKVFYLAAQPGTYANFIDSSSNPIVVNDGEVCALVYGTYWSKMVTGAATVEKVNQLGQQVNLLGLPYYTIDAHINISTGALTPYQGHKCLVAPVVESKAYKYYSGVWGGTNMGAMYGFYDDSLNVISFEPINNVGWIDLTVPTGAKYFIACIKFSSTWTDANINSCSLIEKNKWFEYLEDLTKAVQQDFASNASILYNQSIERISRTLFEKGFMFISKLGIVDKLYDGFVQSNGTYYYSSINNNKVLVAKVTAGKKYKLYISGNNSAAGDVGLYAFYDTIDINDVNHVLYTSTHGVTKNKWVTLTAPAGSEYFAVTLSGWDTGSASDCCFIEESEWVKYLDAVEEITKLTKEYTDKIKPAFNFVSKNLFNAEELTDGYIADDGVFSATPSAPNKNVSSVLIPIKPNTIYYISGRTVTSVPSICCYDENGDPVKVLKPDGTAYGSYAYIYSASNNIIPNGPFKTPATAKTLRFTLRFNNLPASDYLNVMLEEIGEYYDYKFTPSAYQPYNLLPDVDTNSLPQSVSILKGKKIAYNGDSFCESRLGNVNSNNGGAYPVLIAEATGCTFENRAISGGCLSDKGIDPTQARQVVLDVQNMAADADLICFEGGINDWSTDVPLGTFNISDFSGTYDETTILGAMESIFYQALNRWVGKPIVFVICHKIDNPWNSHFAAGTFVEVHNKMIEVCEKWGIPYYNAFDNSALNAAMTVQRNNFFYDTWHPNRKGYVHYYVPQLIKLFESLIQVDRDY